MVSVIRSIKPYWVFLIIARKMGWNIPQEKTVEVGKNQPLAKNWNRKTFIYCSKDKKSFNRIPKEYQPLMRPLLGKVIGEFTCDNVIKAEQGHYGDLNRAGAKIDSVELLNYANDKPLYGWHISNLKIYDKPKDLSEFRKLGKEYHDIRENEKGYLTFLDGYIEGEFLTHPPQTWCYTEVE